MQSSAARKQATGSAINKLAVLSLTFIILIYFFSSNASGSLWNGAKLQLFKMVFISIIIEAMPFILVGVVVSALLQVYVSEQTIRRIIPKNPVLGIITASVLGFIFPICECGMVPAIRRLIQKGMPLYAATTFIMVGPILNPIVFLSTFTAFRNREAIAYSRMGLAFLVALAVGLIVYRFVKPNQLKGSEGNNSHDHEAHHHPGSRNKLLDVMGHSIGEFFEMGKYLMFAAVLVGLLQTFVSKSSLTEFGQEPGSANLIMMGLGFLLSLCSTSDAFVAQSFVTSFSKGSLVAFMVFGPMLNLKSLLMMAAIFKPKFVAAYSTLVFVFVYTGAMALEWLALK